MIKILHLFQNIYNEILSYFVTEDITYEIKASAKNAENAADICIALIHIPKRNLK